MSTGEPREADLDALRRNLLPYTTRAFHCLPKIDRPTILDVGCGTGVPTLQLAELSDGTVIGADRDGDALHLMVNKARESHLDHRVLAVRCEIGTMPFRRGSVDILWAEGSIGGLAFSAAMDEFSRYVRFGGFVVVHDDAAHCAGAAARRPVACLELVERFHLSESVWWEKYYRHLERAVAAGASIHPPSRAGDVQEEIRLFRQDPRRFRSSFLIMRRV